MDNKTSSTEYEILGYKVRLSRGEHESVESAREVVDLVRQESNKIMDKVPHLDRGEVALLVALQFAKEKLDIESQYNLELSDLKDKAARALDLIEEVTPSTM